MSAELTPQTEQIVAGVNRELESRYSLDGAAVDPGSVTVTVTRLDGSALVTDGVTTEGSLGQRTYPLTAAQLLQPDVLTAVWTSDTLGVYTQTIEVVGAALFTIEHARRFDSGALKNASKYPARDIEALRETIGDEFERVAGVAFVPRVARELVRGNGQRVLYLPHERVTTVRSVEVLRPTGWELWPQADIDAIQIGTRYGVSLRSGATWPSEYEHLRVTYVHGYKTPPAPVVNAALLYLRYLIVDSNVGARTISATNEYGSEQYWTPGYSGRGSAINELPFVDKTLRQYAIPAVGVA